MNLSDNITDDKKIFENIISDWEKADTRKEVSGDLINIYKNFTNELKSLGIQKCIDNFVRGVTAVGGNDADPTRRTKVKVKQNKNLSNLTKESILRTLDFIQLNNEAEVLPYDLSQRDLDVAAYTIADMYGKMNNALPLSEFQMSLSHKPEYTFKVGSNDYSYYILYMYLQYVYCNKYLNFNEIENIIEIGPGAGRQVEVIRKLHPHIKFYLIDIGPTLYLCHQYLRSIFKKSFVTYDKITKQKKISLDNDGDIVCLGTWQLDKIEPIGKTLSFGATVFNLMDPIISKRYFDKLKQFSDYFYLLESFSNKPKDIYSLEGSTCFEDFESFLLDKYNLVNKSQAMKPLSFRKDFGELEMSFWEKKI